MKRLIAVFVICLCVGVSLSALDLSAGSGIQLGLSFYPEYEGSLGSIGLSALSSVLSPSFSYGVYGFFDATYVEATVAFSLIFGVIPSIEAGLLGKFPVYFSKFTLFPLLGMEFTFFPFLDLWIRAGIGADIDISRRLYIRPEFLYGVGILGWGISHGPKLRAALGVRL